MPNHPFEHNHLITPQLNKKLTKNPNISPGHDCCAVCASPQRIICTSCKSIKYCSVQCQQRDLRIHNRVCSHLKSIAEDEDFVETPKVLEYLWKNRATTKWTHWDAFFASRKCILNPVAKRCVTAMLSFPLTVIHLIQRMRISNITHIHIIGASDAEIEYLPTWRELSCISNRLVLTFIGPELSRHNTKQYLHSTIQARFLRGFYHEFSNLEKPDLLVCFQPGFSCPDYTQWEPTIRAMLETNCWLFCTSNSLREQKMDELILVEDYGANVVVESQMNTFMSLQVLQSGVMANDVYRKNSAFMVVKGCKKRKRDFRATKAKKAKLY